MASKTQHERDDRKLGKETTSFRKSKQDGTKIKSCVFYKDGDLKFRPVTLVINPRRMPRIETLISELSNKVRGLPFGVRSIFTPRGNDMITSIDGLQHGESYVCSPKRHQARGLDPTKVLPPPRWFYDKPSSGSREYNTLLREYEFEDRARFVGRRYLPRDKRMADAYTRNQPKKITVFKNGDPVVRHLVLINRRTAQTFEQILSDLSGMFQMAIRKLFTIEGKRVSNLSSLINGPDVLVAAGKEPFRHMVGFVYEPEQTDSSPMMRSRIGTRTDDVASRLKRRRDRMMKTRGNWKVWCTTNELSRAGTSAQVTITVYGHKGNSGPVPLGFPDGVKFQPGRMDEFDISVGPNIGEIYKIRVAHDDTGATPEWFCDEVKMKDVDTDETLTFPCRRWMARDEDDHEICREIPATRRGEPHLPIIKYEVTVSTGDLWNGGTSANVYLTIYGDRGDTGIRQLFVNKKDDAFNKGQTNHFTVEAVSLGHLKKVIVGHDGTVPGDGWYLEKLSVQEPDAKAHEVYHFYCGRWLDEGEDDGKIVRELKVQDEYMEDILEKRNWEYEKWKFENRNQVLFISMLTGKALRIKSDGTVDGLGEETDSGSTFIVSSKKPMVRIFTSMLNGNFHLAVDHGKITGQGRGGPQCEFRIHVQPDRTIMLEAAKSPLQFITLQENGKLGDSRSYLDKDPAKRFHVYARGVTRHRGVVILRTSNIQAISVDHDKTVYATGRCNRAAHFRVHKVDVGGIRMFESMIYPGFYLRLKDGKFDCNGSRNEDSHFLVQKHKDKGYFTLQMNKQRGMYVGFTPRGGVRPTIDTGINNIHVFPEIVEAGVSKQKLDEDKLTPILEKDGYEESPRSHRTPEVKQRAKTELEEGDSRIIVSSSETLTNAQVALVVFGDRGSTGPILLSGPPDKGPLFRAGKSDEFKINLAKVGKPFKARLELMPKSQTKDPSWKVQNLTIIDMITEEKLVFPFNRWMSRNQEDQEIMRELPAVVKGHEEEALSVVNYIVTVYTGKEPGMQTDARVYINIFGEYGDTGKRHLRISNRPKLFQKGQADQFEVEAVQLGQLSKILMGHDETRPGDGWFLEKVIIREGKNANMQFVFPCSRWFDSGMEDRKLERILPVQEPAPTKITPVRELSNLPVLPPIGTPQSRMSEKIEEPEEVPEVKEEENSSEEETIEEPIPNETDVEVLEDDVIQEIHEVSEIDEVEPEETEDEDEAVAVAVEEDEELTDVIEETDAPDTEVEEPSVEEEVGEDEVLPIDYIEEKMEDQEPENEVNTQVQLITHSDSGTDMTDSVVLYVYGTEATVGPLDLGSGTQGLFQPGGNDEVAATIYPHIGSLYKIRIGLKEEVEGCDWHLDQLALVDTMHGNRIEFDVDRWMSRQRDDFDVWREVSRDRDGEPPLPIIRYQIEVQTGDLPDSGTEAAVFVNMMGERGDCGIRKLYHSQSSGKKFSQGKADIFILEAVSLGAIKSLYIGHDDKIPGHGWYLSHVNIKELNSDDQNEFYFPCDRWLDAGFDDKEVERELFPQPKPNKKQSTGEYHMSIETAEDSQPSQGCKVILVVYGDKGRSDDIELYAPNATDHLFDPGNVDEFEVATGDIGDIYKIRITREDKAAWKAWHVEEVKMEDKSTAEVFTFIFNRWMSRDMEDGDLSRELPVVSSGRELQEVKCYEVTVITGDHWAAETDAAVFISLIGSQGDSGRRILHKGKNVGKRKFMRGQEDTFVVEAVDLKDLESVVIGHDGRGSGSGWFLESVTVTEVGHPSQWIFPCGRWLDEGEDDGKIERTLRLMNIPNIPEPKTNALPHECEGEWKVIVRTSDFPGAETHAQVYLTILGSKDYSHPIPLGDGSPTMTLFDQGNESMFDVDIAEIGQMCKIRLEHDNRNADPSWHVDWVHMEHAASGYKCLFSFDQWLSEDKEDKQVFRERAVDIPGCMPSPVLRYIILIQTGSVKNGGAHGGISTVNLIGSNGETGQQLLAHPLSNASDCMAEGVLDVYMLEAVSVGEIKSLRLGFEGRGRAKEWFVSCVKVMESLSSLSEYVFTANAWLDDDENSAVSLNLTDTILASSLPTGVNTKATGHHFPDSTGSWSVWAWTGQQDNANTTDAVHMWLYGTTGHTGPIHLNENGALGKGSVLSAKVNSGNIGEIFKIRLAFAEEIGNSSWYLERLKLKDNNSRQEFNFEYHSWIQCDDDNPDGTVELPAIRPDIPPLPETKYTISVTTGDLPCAETSADVNLMIVGQWGDSGQRRLNMSRNTRQPYHRGQTDEFQIKSLHLGAISKILLGHAEQGRGHGWFCQHVSISSVSPKGEKTETVFPCNRWMDTGVDDRKTKREFTPLGSVSNKDMVPGSTPSGTWTCQVKMASDDMLDVSKSPQASSHQVSLVMYGTSGVAGPIELGGNGEGNMAPGSTTTYKNLQFGNTGEITKIRASVGLEEDHVSPWCIQQIMLEDETTREKLKFDFSDHVGEIGGDIRKERPVIRPDVVTSPMVTYDLIIDTEDEEKAGTSAKVYATLYGSKGDSGRRLLRTPQGCVPFVQGQKLKFEVEAVDLGELEKLVLTKGPGDPWMLNQVVVKAGHFGPVENVFIWTNWIGDPDKRDTEVEVTLPVISGRPSAVAIPTEQFPDFPVTRGQWTVETLTGDQGTSGVVDDVLIVFSGTKGESDPIPLKAKREKPFQPGMTDNMEINLSEDVGELIKMRIGFDDNSSEKAWHLKKIKMEDKDTQDTFWFSLNEPVQVNDVSDGWKEFPVVWPGVFILPVLKYKVTVETGDDANAGTFAPIMFQLNGQMGSTGYRFLKDTRTMQPKFQQGQSDTFIIEAVSLMSLDSATIGHTDPKPESGWFLNKVTVRPENEEEDYVFGCNRWLDASQGDGETMVTLYSNGNDDITEPLTSAVEMNDTTEEETATQPPPSPPAKGTSYNIKVTTGSEVGHGTNAPVVVFLYGERANSGPLTIGGEDGKKLGEGQTQEFEIRSDEELGDLFKVNVGFDSQGKEQEWYSDIYSCPSWFPEMMTVKDLRSGKEYHFEMHQWVRMEDDHDYWKEFPVKKENASQMLVVRDYLVDVYTGTSNNSSTQANVSLQIHGEHGDTGWRHLHGSRTNANKFETGSHDLFRVEAVDLGAISKVKVKHDGSDPGSGWFLDRISIKESEEASEEYVFECERWLDVGEDDKAIEREIYLTRKAPVQVQEPEKEEEHKAGDWRVYTVTNPQAGSGTDANVTLTVFGEFGDSGPLPLGDKDGGLFKDGSTDQFNIWLEPADIGEIKKIRLQHDNSGSNASWHVDTLTMEHPLSGQQFKFAINRWLSLVEKDGDIVYEGAAEHPNKSNPQVCRYSVKTVTENEAGADTDANVYINIVGSNGDTGRRQLRNNDDENSKFGVGMTNMFSLEALDLGDLEKVVIGHDSSGQNSSWKLQCVMIRKLDSGNNTDVFPWGRWLPGEEDNEVVIFVNKDLDENYANTVGAPGQADDDLNLDLPHTERTEELPDETNRTDEGYLEDGTYRTNIDGTNGDQTSRMFTASDITEEPPASQQQLATDREGSVVHDEGSAVPDSETIEEMGKEDGNDSNVLNPEENHASPKPSTARESEMAANENDTARTEGTTDDSTKDVGGGDKQITTSRDAIENDELKENENKPDDKDDAGTQRSEINADEEENKDEEDETKQDEGNDDLKENANENEADSSNPNAANDDVNENDDKKPEEEATSNNDNIEPVEDNTGKENDDPVNPSPVDDNQNNDDKVENDDGTGDNSNDNINKDENVEDSKDEVDNSIDPANANDDSKDEKKADVDDANKNEENGVLENNNKDD